MLHPAAGRELSNIDIIFSMKLSGNTSGRLKAGFRERLLQLAVAILRGSSYMTKDGFRAAKQKVIKALQDGTYLHETSRSAIDVKNLLSTGVVTPNEVCDLLKRSNGNDHSSSPHHNDRSVDVHIIKREGWYIKFYFLEPDTIFISVHK